ncbi:hypothetical protein COHA_000692 [Chlorella ohadii]|uniref:SRCR domain-containing protein n=1 Tax=Chlorella ohadii TaxID=2649997 RepID=A0AAD5H8V5_9CHLO|nr:hypothetical protein COHA_000692 [Chlorella ohadii]
MRSHHSATAVALVTVGLLAWALPASAAPRGGQPNPLARFTSWQKAWAALSPYQLSPSLAAAAPCNRSGPALAAACGEAAIQGLWGQWKSKYKLNYAGAVNTLRYGYFKKNVQGLITKLATCPKTVWIAVNYRADWSPNELGANKKIFVPKIKPSVPVKPGAQPPSWDWRRSALDKVTPAKDQGRCGSCFAFAAVAAIESKLLIQYNKTYRGYPIDLSEQQMVDCVNAGQGSYLSQGCAGGYLEDALAYAARRYVVKEGLYPYTSGATGVQKLCGSTLNAKDVGQVDKVQLTGGGFNQLQQWSATALRQAVQVAPVMVGIYAPEGGLFEFYSGGTWPASACSLPPGAPNATKAMVNHALLVVGYDMTTPGNYHWIVKNSWGRGEEWGENGFGRIAMMPDGTYGTCFMYYYMVSPTELVPTNLAPVPEPARTSLRLVNPNPTNPAAGRLEVFHNNQWGSVCMDGFNAAAATVVCKQLRRGDVGTVVPTSWFGEGNGKPLWLDEVNCRGDEERLEVCAHAGWGVSNCGHKEDVGVVCRNATQGVVSGRLELRYNNGWRPVCSDGFDTLAATVVCKQLGQGSAGKAIPLYLIGAYGQGSGPTRLASIKCRGTEASWEACRSAVWTNGGCGPSGDVAVSCSAAAPTVRLVYGNQTSVDQFLTRGRLELGLSNSGYAVPSATYGEGTGPILFDDVACTGSEATIQQCPRAPPAKIDCTHREDVGVTCSGADSRVIPAGAFGNNYGARARIKLQVKNNCEEDIQVAIMFWFNPWGVPAGCKYVGLFYHADGNTNTYCVHSWMTIKPGQTAYLADTGFSRWYYSVRYSSDLVPFGPKGESHTLKWQPCSQGQPDCFNWLYIDSPYVDSPATPSPVAKVSCTDPSVPTNVVPSDFWRVWYSWPALPTPGAAFALDVTITVDALGGKSTSYHWSHAVFFTDARPAGGTALQYSAVAMMGLQNWGPDGTRAALFSVYNGAMGRPDPRLAQDGRAWCNKEGWGTPCFAVVDWRVGVPYTFRLALAGRTAAGDTLRCTLIDSQSGASWTIGETFVPAYYGSPDHSVSFYQVYAPVASCAKFDAAQVTFSNLRMSSGGTGLRPTLVGAVIPAEYPNNPCPGWVSLDICGTTVTGAGPMRAPVDLHDAVMDNCPA